MNKLGIEWPEISGYWDRLGGEDAAREYLASIQPSEKELAEEDWEKFDFVCFLAQKAGWSSLALSLTQATLSVLSTILPAEHPRMALGWLNLAKRSKGMETKMPIPNTKRCPDGRNYERKENL